MNFFSQSTIYSPCGLLKIGRSGGCFLYGEMTCYSDHTANGRFLKTPGVFSFLLAGFNFSFFLKQLSNVFKKYFIDTLRWLGETPVYTSNIIVDKSSVASKELHLTLLFTTILA